MFFLPLIIEDLKSNMLRDIQAMGDISLRRLAIVLRHMQSLADLCSSLSLTLNCMV